MAPTILFLHHPPFPLGVDYFREMLLRNGDELETLLDRHPQVKHVAFGHVHLTAYGWSSGRSFSATRGTCHPIHPLFEGMSTRYVDRPPSYEVVLVEGGRILAHSMEVADMIVAREYADDDGGPGRIELLKPEVQWARK
ncbi:hypothetical protein O7A70_26795 [Mesorhizobium sp. Cs1299R1N1]|uniref:hypothetical protein n=1 Tax=Mesorhizobium sp. Cs1299R1N1 TaxID=3015172 RepID=UPI00301C82B5